MDFDQEIFQAASPERLKQLQKLIDQYKLRLATNILSKVMLNVDSCAYLEALEVHKEKFIIDAMLSLKEGPWNPSIDPNKEPINRAERRGNKNKLGKQYKQRVGKKSAT